MTGLRELISRNAFANAIFDFVLLCFRFPTMILFEALPGGKLANVVSKHCGLDGESHNTAGLSGIVWPCRGVCLSYGESGLSIIF